MWKPNPQDLCFDSLYGDPATPVTGQLMRTKRTTTNKQTNEHKKRNRYTLGAMEGLVSPKTYEKVWESLIIKGVNKFHVSAPMTTVHRQGTWHTGQVETLLRPINTQGVSINTRVHTKRHTKMWEFIRTNRQCVNRWLVFKVMFCSRTTEPLILFT